MDAKTFEEETKIEDLLSLSENQPGSHLDRSRNYLNQLLSVYSINGLNSVYGSRSFN